MQGCPSSSHRAHFLHVCSSNATTPRNPPPPRPADKGKGCACSSPAASQGKPFLRDTYLRHIPARSPHRSQHCHMPGAGGDVSGFQRQGCMGCLVGKAAWSSLQHTHTHTNSPERALASVSLWIWPVQGVGRPALPIHLASLFCKYDENTYPIRVIRLRQLKPP